MKYFLSVVICIVVLFAACDVMARPICDKCVTVQPDNGEPIVLKTIKITKDGVVKTIAITKNGITKIITITKNGITIIQKRPIVKSAIHIIEGRRNAIRKRIGRLEQINQDRLKQIDHKRSGQTGQKRSGRTHRNRSGQTK